MKFLIFIIPPADTRERIFEFQKSFSSNKVPYFYEPHITLKAPSGLTEDKSWLAPLIALVGNHAPFEIKFKGSDNFEDRVLFLDLEHSSELVDLHIKMVSLFDPEPEALEKFYEGPLFHPHLTLGNTTWGGMSKGELQIMKKEAEAQLHTLSPFLVTFVRLYQKDTDGELYHKILDIPLKD